MYLVDKKMKHEKKEPQDKNDTKMRICPLKSKVVWITGASSEIIR